VQVALVYLLYFNLLRQRRKAVNLGQTRVSNFRENRSEPEASLFARNSLQNQFELPPLFIAAALALFATGHADPVAVGLAWLFVLSRLVHAWIHVGSNRIRYRWLAFATGFAVVALMWIWLAVNIAAN
jgi:hypothetical protein